jgi:hypothetical protein
VLCVSRVCVCFSVCLISVCVAYLWLFCFVSCRVQRMRCSLVARLAVKSISNTQQSGTEAQTHKHISTSTRTTHNAQAEATHKMLLSDSVLLLCCVVPMSMLMSMSISIAVHVLPCFDVLGTLLLVCDVLVLDVALFLFSLLLVVEIYTCLCTMYTPYIICCLVLCCVVLCCVACVVLLLVCWMMPCCFLLLPYSLLCLLIVFAFAYCVCLLLIVFVLVLFSGQHCSIIRESADVFWLKDLRSLH